MRISTLKFDRGSLILHPPPKGKDWIEYATWDDRIEKFRIPAKYYPQLVMTLQENNTNFVDHARDFTSLDLKASFQMTPYPHQQEALLAWKKAQRQGVVVLPTAAGKTYLAQLAMESTPRSTLIVVPTIDLMQQWYAQIEATFPDAEIGLLGGGSRDKTPILIATYDSAAIHAETLGNKYALQIFDECHHLPTDFYRVIAEYAIAPYRLGLTATVERSDGKHQELQHLIGNIVYEEKPQSLSGKALAEHQIIPIKVKLSEKEQEKYRNAIEIRNQFLRKNNIKLGGLQGWQIFVSASARSTEGRKAMLAHREAKEIATGTTGKIRVLIELICEHQGEKILIFTNDNATVYRVSQEFLIPAITHQTPVKERHEILTKYREGEYRILVTSHVLNEGIDVPDATIAIILSGTGSTREYIQRLGRVLRKGKKEDKVAILYEVIAEDTTEEKTAQRRQKGYESKPKQLEILPQKNPHNTFKVAENKKDNNYQV